VSLTRAALAGLAAALLASCNGSIGSTPTDAGDASLPTDGSSGDAPLSGDGAGADAAVFADGASADAPVPDGAIPDGAIPDDASPVDGGADGATALPSAHEQGPDYGVEAPDDADSTPYAEKDYSNGAECAASLTHLPTISRGGIRRFGPVTVDGLVAIEHHVRAGDPTRYTGHRAELPYEGAKVIQHGVEYWMAAAFKLGPEWTFANSGGNSDRQVILQVHQDSSETTVGNPFGLQWIGTGAKQGLNWMPERYDGSGADPVYCDPDPVPDQWFRVVQRYRSGAASQGPILEVWLAKGAGPFVKLTPLPGMSATTPFGDPAQNLTRDWPKIGIYKWNADTASNPYGAAPQRWLWTSGLFFAQGTDLYDAAVAALAPFAID
jgi:hypothetical protein